MMKIKNKIIKLIVEVSKVEQSRKKRLISFVPQVAIFIFFVPVVLFVIPYFIFDKWFELDKIHLHLGFYILFSFLALTGWTFAVWSILIQYKFGNGTPMPVMATQKIVVKRPFSICRNPMALGTIIFYVCIGILIGSVSAIIMTIIFTIILLTYIKVIEEKELEIRFGQDYVDYKKKTPFLFPKLF